MANTVGQIGIIAGPSSRVQWFISAFTQSLAVHVVISLGNGTVVSAMPDGVMIEDLSQYPDAIWSDFEYPEGVGEAIALWALGQLGKRYNYVDDALIGVEYLLNWHFPKQITRNVDKGRRWQCSQLADAALTQCYMDLFPGVDGRVSPATFAALYVARGWWPVGLWSGHAHAFNK